MKAGDSPDPTASAVQAAGMTVLIVDDEPVNISLLASALKDTCAILTADNGHDAIRLIRERSPDLVLLDIMMPELDGLQVCRLIRAEKPFADLPVIFVSAMDSDDAEARGLELGAVDYIAKPVNLRLAKLRVRNQLELRRSRNVIKQQNEELKKAAEYAEHLSLSDPLTNLPNRRLLLERLQAGLAQAKRFHRSLAVMFLDLDHFKQINDSFGHEASDSLLREVGRRLAASVRAGDTVARSGGDEFIIVLPEIENPTDATVVAEKIIQTVGQPVRIGGQRLDITTSIGIAVYPVDGADDALELMKSADTAMYAAKNAGRNRYKVFDSPGNSEPPS